MLISGSALPTITVTLKELPVDVPVSVPSIVDCIDTSPPVARTTDPPPTSMFALSKLVVSDTADVLLLPRLFEIRPPSVLPRLGLELSELPVCKPPSAVTANDEC